MARRKKQEGGGATSEWLNTYADMVTLLLTFFILLFSMSSLDATKFNLMSEAFKAQLSQENTVIISSGGEHAIDTGNMGPVTDDMRDDDANLKLIFAELEAYIKEQNLEESVQVAMDEGYVFIRFMDNMLFQPNSPNLRPEHVETLRFVGEGIRSVQSQANLIRIDGHTAAVPENPNYEVSDRILSSERANTVLIFFEDEVGIDGQKMMASSYGKWVPIASNDTEEERSKNRRVEILISGDNIVADELDSIYEKLRE